MSIVRNISIYTFVGFFGAGINFLLMPVLSYHLTPTDYGIISLLNTYVTLIIPIVSLLAGALLGVEYYRMEDKREFASLFSSVSLVPILPSIIFFVIVYFSYNSIAGSLELPLGAKWWALSSFLIALTNIYVDTAINFQVIEKQPKLYAIYNIGKTLLEIGLTLLFVIVLDMGWRGRLLSWLVTSIVFCCLSLFYFYKRGLLSTDIRLTYVLQGIMFGLPLILHTLGKFVVNQSDRLFIAKMVSIDEAGIYNVGYTIGTVMLIFANAFSNYFNPYIMERLNKITTTAKREIVRLGYIFTAAMALLLIIIQIGGGILFRYFISPKYLSGMPYVFWIGLGYIFWGGYLFLSSFIFYCKQGRFLAWLAVVNIISNLMLNYIFIKYYGGIGATYATALSFLIIFILTAIKTHRLIPLPWLYPITQMRKRLI